MTTYAIINDENGKPSSVQRTDDNGQVWAIPMDESNSDYQAYLAYVANGNKVPSNSSTPQAGA